MSYSSYDHDRLEAAEKMRIERTIYFEEKTADISALAALPMEQLQAMREESAAAEQAVFEGLQRQAAAWEEQAGKTLLLHKAIEYARTPPVKHTSNEWEQQDNNRFKRSNMVYQMNYYFSENTRYDRAAQQSVPYSYTLTWSVRTNGADGYRGTKIAGQDRKVFATQAEMEKYLNGRIKAYQHLFTEISPPIPKEYEKDFKVNGCLLPGYTVEGEQPQQTQQPPAQEQTPQPQEAPAQEPQTEAAKPEPTPTQEAAPQQGEQAAVLSDAQQQPRPVIPIVLTSEKPTERMKEITDRLEQGITQLFESERYKEYLRVMSKFHNYSFNNTMLIAMQKPDASLVAGFSAWKNNFQRNVVKGEKGIKIIAPSPFKVKQETEKIDPVTQKPVLGRDGKPVMEEKEVTIPAYKVVSVFDVSQTEGKELPDIVVDQLLGDVEQYRDFFAALEKTSPVPIGFEKIEGGAHGYYHLEDKRIAIDEGMSELQTLKTAIHEIAHAKLHDIDLKAPKEQQQDGPDRRTREVQAESVAYAVCQHYGLDTSDYSFGYVAGWSSGKELSELKASLETIRSTAAEIINSVDGHFKELQQQREAAREQAQPQAPAPEFTYKMEANPRTDRLENAFFLQAYENEGNGKAIPRDVLFVGTHQQCADLMRQLESGDMTQEQVKALFEQSQQAPVFDKLTPEKRQALSDTVKDTLQALVDIDLKTGGEVSAGTLEAIAAQGYSYRDGQLEKQQDTFTIYQLKHGDETRDFRFDPYDRLQAAGLAVDPANYEQVYSAPLESGMTLDGIFEKFNLDRPADFTGHSLSMSDIVVLHQNGQDAAHYVDRFGFKEVPEFLQEQQPQRTPDELTTGEKITTPRGTFYVTDMSREQMEAAGYGFHHHSDDGKYAIMGNGTRAFAISTEPQQRENPLKAAEQTTEQNYNMIDGRINNTPTVDAIEARAKAGEVISLVDLADAIKADKERGKAQKGRGSQKPEKKPSIRAQLDVAKKQAKEQPKKQPEKSKGKEMEV